MILTLGTSLALARSMVFDRVIVDGVNRARQVHVAASGKSVNAARTIHQLGQPVTVLGFVGGLPGRQAVSSIKSEGIDSGLIEIAGDTRVCVTVIDESRGSATELVEESPPVTENDVSRLVEEIRTRAPAALAIVISGSLAPGVQPSFYADICRIARENGVPVLVDARDAPLRAALEHRPAVVKLNAEELATTVGKTVDAVGAARHLLNAGAGAVVVTLGASGALLVDPAGARRLSVPRVRAVSAIGAGDATAGGIAVGLVTKLPILDTVVLGLACGTSSVASIVPGQIDPVTVEQLRREIGVEPLPPS